MGLNTWRPSGTWQSPARTMRSGAARVMAAPSNAISPPLGRTRPEMVESSVVLPAPLPPMSATTSPGRTCSEARRTACTLP
jgi:hypothetical protein